MTTAEKLAAALEYMVEVCPAIDPQGEEAHERARAAIAAYEAEKASTPDDVREAVERLSLRVKDHAQTVELKHREAAKGHDWVILNETFGHQDMLDIQTLIRATEESALFKKAFELEALYSSLLRDENEQLKAAQSNTTPLPDDVRDAFDRLKRNHIGYGPYNGGMQSDADLSTIQKALIRAAQSNNGWMPIDSAPSDTPVIVYCNGLVGEAIKKIEYAATPVFPDGQPYWWWANTDSEYAEDINPAHWMPLPQPPRAAESAGKGGV